VTGEIILDVSDSGLGQLAKTNLDVRLLGADVPVFLGVDFDLRKIAERLEVRLHVSEGLIIQIDKLAIFRRNIG
jgi:hypothetical protein